MKLDVAAAEDAAAEDELGVFVQVFLLGHYSGLEQLMALGEAAVVGLEVVVVGSSLQGCWAVGLIHEVELGSSVGQTLDHPHHLC